MLKMKNQLYLFVLLASSNIIISQDKNFATISQNGLSQEKFMTYNVLNYDGDNDRDSYFIEIINEIEPSIIILQEINGIEGFSSFYDNILNVVHPNTWDYADFIDQSASDDIALFYKSENFSFISTSEIYTAQTNGTRNVVEWIMVHNATSILFNLYGVHFKANSGYEEQRRIEMTILRYYLNGLPEQSNFIVAGDFNIYNASTEPGFDAITGAGTNTNGQLFDPINMIGDWHANVGETDCEYAAIHTQSTRVSSFGGGATGGMDDRFDWILVSAAILDEDNDLKYIDGTYLSYGNDGNHCNQAINNGDNTAVSQSVVNSLHEASDHLPVIASFYFVEPDTITASIELDNEELVAAKLHGSFPNPFNVITTLKYDLLDDGWVKIIIYDMMGRLVKTLLNSSQTAGSKYIRWNATNDRNEPVPSGLYLYTIESGKFRQMNKIVLLK